MQNISEQLKRYKLGDQIGAGGMATVYRARDHNLNRDVAIKILHSHLVNDSTFLQRFELEAQLIASFNHPNIIQIYDFDKLETPESQTYYMVMPLLPGYTLGDLVQNVCAQNITIPHNRVLEIVRQMASALDYAHARDMVHRDVKPANIIFDERDQAILTDFGIARLVNTAGMTQEGTIIGTPTYMSPEQATGQESDHRSDIYSLAIIAYEMLTGRPPFDADSTVSILVKHAHEQPPEISEYLAKPNPALNDVMQRALAKLPESRYQSATEFSEALRHALSHEETSQFAEPQPIPTHARVKRSPLETAVLSDVQPPSSLSQSQSLTQTIFQEVRTRPVGFIALGVAIIALLIAARLANVAQNMQAQPTEITTQQEFDNSSMTGGAMFFETSFSADDPNNSYWQQNSSGAVTRTLVDEGYRIFSTRLGRASTALIDPDVFTFDNIQITLTGALVNNLAQTSAYGIVFRYQNPANFYVFAVDGLGRYSIWKLEDSQWCELRSEVACADQDFDMVWTAHEAIELAGGSNHLLLDAHEDMIYAYVNDEFLFMLDDTTFTEQGGVGIYVATGSATQADVIISSYSVQESQPSTGSMTGG